MCRDSTFIWHLCFDFQHDIRDGEFAQKFNGVSVTIGGLHVHVYEVIVAQGTSISMERNRWFKQKEMVENSREGFILEGEAFDDTSNGAQRTSLRPPWREAIFFIK